MGIRTGNAFGALLKEAAHQRQIFFGQGDHNKQRIDLLGLNSLPGIRQRDIAKNFRAIQAICLAQHIDDLGIRLPPNDAYPASL